MTLEIIRIPGNRSYPPRLSSFTRRFWESLAQGEWCTTRCENCDRFTFPPKAVCPHCWSERMRWDQLAATGLLYSWTRIHSAPMAFAGEAPYAVGVIDLEIGLRVATRLFEPSPSDIRIGSLMEIIVLQYDDGPLFAARSTAHSY